MLVVTVDFELKPEHAADFSAAMLRQAHASLDKEAGCLQFDVCFPPDGSPECFLYEKYVDSHAFELHLASEHFLQFDETTRDWIQSKRVRKWKTTDGAASAAS